MMVNMTNNNKNKQGQDLDRMFDDERSDFFIASNKMETVNTMGIAYGGCGGVTPASFNEFVGKNVKSSVKTLRDRTVGNLGIKR